MCESGKEESVVLVDFGPQAIMNLNGRLIEARLLTEDHLRELVNFKLGNWPRLDWQARKVLETKIEYYGWKASLEYDDSSAAGQWARR